MGKKISENIRLIAKKGIHGEGFDIYIDFSGKYEYLMFHRENNEVFNLLKGGVKVNELNRKVKKVISVYSLSGQRYIFGKNNSICSYRKKLSCKIENSLDHIIIVLNDYLKDMAA